MNCLLVLVIVIFLVCVIAWTLNSNEGFQLSQVIGGRLREGGAAMIRGDLPIQPVQQSWFNSQYGPSGLTPGFIPEQY